MALASSLGTMASHCPFEISNCQRLLNAAKVARAGENSKIRSLIGKLSESTDWPEAFLKACAKSSWSKAFVLLALEALTNRYSVAHFSPFKRFFRLYQKQSLSPIQCGNI